MQPRYNDHPIQSDGYPLRGSSSCYSSHGGYSGLAISSYFNPILGKSYGCRPFGYFSREYPIYVSMVLLAQTAQIIRSVIPSARGGIHGRQSSF